MCARALYLILAALSVYLVVTIAAFVYNLTTDLIGGIEVTLADRD